MHPEPPWKRIHLEQTSSTQQEARRLCLLEPGVRRAIRSVRQLSGRGRRGNSWASPEGGLWCTLTLPCREGPDPFHNLLVALAALRAVSDGLGVGHHRLALKWPNDLIFDGRKWGGVLAEVFGSGKPQEVLFGIGLNLQISENQLKEQREIPVEATSILAEFGHSPSPEAVLESILSHLDQLLEEDRTEGGRERNRLQIAEVLDTIGRRIRWVTHGDEDGEGEATGIASDGALIVERNSPTPGRVDQLRSAEISHVRVQNDC